MKQPAHWEAFYAMGPRDRMWGVRDVETDEWVIGPNSHLTRARAEAIAAMPGRILALELALVEARA